MRLLKAYSLLEITKIPRSQGLYAFYLDAINHEKVGLLGSGPYPEEKLVSVRRTLLKRIKMVMEFMHKNKMSGSLYSADATSNIEGGFILDAERIIPHTMFEKVQSLDVNEIPSFLTLLKDLPLLSQPIYVGITQEQTLYDRYNQHKWNYDSGPGESSFGGRFASSGFDWDDLLFTCIEFEHSEENVGLLKQVEKYLQILSKPILSRA